MSVIGEFTVPAASFCLEESLGEVPAMVVEPQRLATHSTMEVMPFLWAGGGDFDEFTDALRSDSTVTEVSIVEEAEEAVLYKIQWNQEVISLIDLMVDHHAAIIEARAQADEWRFKLRFAKEGQVTSFQRYFDERGHHFEVHRLYHPDAARQREYDLTEEQYDTLVAAFDEGYFDVPRTTSVDELAERLGVSANAISQRIRRASSNLIGSTLEVAEEDHDHSGDDDG